MRMNKYSTQNIEEWLQPETESFYDPLLFSDEPIEIDYDYVELFLDEAGRLVTHYKKAL